MIYFVSTPIGNLKDITLRAIETLKSVDVIACEDTRNSLKLLNHYDIHKKLIAYHKFNEKASTNGIINLAKEGKNIAIISDSGTPLISDPGEILVKSLIENNIPFTVIPGASAVISALILSGFAGGAFTFVGFLNEQNKKRRAELENIKNFEGAIVFYVSPYNIFDDIKSIYEILGDQEACLVNEITKMYEKTLHFSLASTLEIEPKGEYVLVVNNKPQKQKNNQSIEEQLKTLLYQGIEKNEAIKIVAKNNNLKKSEVYKFAINIK